MKSTTCCFTGHRALPSDRMEGMTERLGRAVDGLINRGVDTFLSGGALGFDQLVAEAVLARRDAGARVRLVFALPCRGQDKFWSEAQKRHYRTLLARADEVVYVAEAYAPDCMAKRNRYMVERSGWCICALLNPRSGTGQTVRYAKKLRLNILNVAEV